ncbi:hypothetical protein [Jeotgalibaca porci]|uniref:hypothetical protein n=2 Tax=Jeotgalibaca porci TaxID=1868793 RepID=UPI0035A18441
MTPFLIPYFFNLVIFVFILVIWITFIRNLIRTFRQDQRGKTSSSRSQHTQRNQWDKAHTQTVRQVHVDNATRSRRNSQSQQPKTQTWQDLLKQDPKELYQLLRENMPDSYESEIKAIFNSQRPMMELVKFLRRKDVWPVLQSLPERLNSSRSTQKPLVKQKVAKTVPVAVQQYDDDYDEMFVQMDGDANYLSQEVDAFVSEYDEFADYFSSLLQDIPTSAPEVRATRHHRNKDNANIDQKINREWLRDAVIASMILERPDI